MRQRLARILEPRGALSPTLALLLRVPAGAVFVGFSLGKFLRHDAEAAAFERYGVPFPDASTYAVGAVELVGGLLLVVGLAVRPAALGLAATAAGAVATAGRIEGGPIHLGLAPALLAVMAVLVAVGAGRWSLDAPLATLLGRPGVGAH